MALLPLLRLKGIRSRSRFWTALVISRLLLAKRHYYVLGYPSSGTSWCCRLLSSYFGVPVFWPNKAKALSLAPSVIHLHRFAAPPSRTVYMVRDGRDVMVSRYFKLTRRLQELDGKAVRRMRDFCGNELTKENAKANLPGFIRYLFEAHPHSGMSYQRHLAKGLSGGFVLLKYEDLLLEGATALSSALEEIPGTAVDPDKVERAFEENSFKRLTGRRPGDEDSSRHMRKGVAGDWKNHFSPEARATFDRYAGDVLVGAGYESDRSWIDRETT